MPTYEYVCACGSQKQTFFKSLPSEAKQKHANCDECDGQMDRIVSQFFALGGTNYAVAKAADFGAGHMNVGGQRAPAFTDNNGVKREIRSAADVDRWCKDNRLGKSRMVEWTNTKTGEKSWVPQRVVMRAGPDGEPMDAPTVRESVQLVPLDKEVIMPTQDPFGNKMVNGVRSVPPDKIVSKLVDPETGKRFTMGNLWGNEPGTGAAANDFAIAKVKASGGRKAK